MTLINLETCPYPYYHLATSKEEIKEAVSVRLKNLDLL